MKWEPFEESKTELPEVTVEKMIDGFSNATKDLAQLSVTPKSDMARLSSDKLKTRFQFVLLLTSKNLPDYSYKVLELGYNVDLYPVKVLISPTIIEELNNKGEGYTQISSIDKEESLQKMLDLVFESQKFKDIVGGLMKIARRKDDLPF